MGFLNFHFDFAPVSERGEMASGNSSNRSETAWKQMALGSDWGMMMMLQSMPNWRANAVDWKALGPRLPVKDLDL